MLKKRGYNGKGIEIGYTGCAYDDYGPGGIEPANDASREDMVAASSQNNKLRRVILSPSKYLAIDFIRNEVRLFEREDKRNVFIWSMPI